MENFFGGNGNNDPYKLQYRIDNKLKQMDVLLNGRTNGKELINLAYDIALTLHALKINQRMIKLDDKIISDMVNKLPNIDTESWQARAEKEQLSNFFHNLKHINSITTFNYTAMLRMKCKASIKNNEETMEFRSKDIGLENIGATCYMNATLQALGQIPELQDFFLHSKPR